MTDNSTPQELRGHDVVSIQGDTEFIAMCGKLADKVKNKIARVVLTAAAEKFLPASQALVHRRTGMLAASLVVAVKVQPRKGRIRVSYGPEKSRVVRDLSTGLTGIFQGRMSLAARQRYQVLRDPMRYAHLVELGTRPHVVRAKGKWPLISALTGKSFGRAVTVSARPYPFMRPVFDAMAGTAVREIQDQARAMIESEVAKSAATMPKPPGVT